MKKVIPVIIILIICSVFVFTGIVDAVFYINEPNWTGTFYNTAIVTDNIRLNKGVPVGTYTDDEGDYSLHGAHDVFVSGDYAYTVSSADDTLAVWDISGHGNPVPVGTVTDTNGDYSLDSARSVFVSGDYAYTASCADDTLAVWDISGHGNPIPVGTYTDSSGAYSLNCASDVFVSGDYAYTVCISGHTLAVWDISGHGNPVPVGTYTSSSGGYSLEGSHSVFVSGDYAYTVTPYDSSFAVWDISAHGNPVPVGTYTSTSGDYSLNGAYAVFVSGDYAYTSSAYHNNLVVWDISGHGNPVPVGTYTDSAGDYSLDQVESIFVSGDYAYTASYADDTLAVWDISGHGNPVPVGTYTDSAGDYSLEYAWGVFVSGDYAYTVSSTDATLAVFDINHYSNGDYISQVFDAGVLANWDISWSSTIPAETDITIQTRTSNDNVIWSAWSANHLNPSQLIVTRYLQYKATLTTNTDYTPSLEEVHLSYFEAVDPEITGIEDIIILDNQQPIEICATIIDDGSGLESVTLYYDSEQVLMVEEDNNLWCGTIPVSEETILTYYITAIDKAGKDTTSLEYDIEIFDFIVELEQGLNLFSIPLVPEDTNINEVFGEEVSSNAQVIWSYTYDAGEGKNVWNYNEPIANGSEWTADSYRIQNIIPGYGYYIKMNNGVTVYNKNSEKMYGDDEFIMPKPPVVTLTPSWNLIGHYGMREDVSKDDALDTLAGSYSTMLDENGSPILGGVPLIPTKGYWLFLTGTDNLDYAPSEEAYNY